MRPRSPFVIALLTFSFGLAGCGGGDDENAERFDGDAEEVAAVIDELTAAAREGDGDRICDDLLTENLRISIQRAAGRPCADEVRANVFAESARFSIESLDVEATVATASVVDEAGQRSELVFEREADGWRISRIG